MYPARRKYIAIALLLIMVFFGLPCSTAGGKITGLFLFSRWWRQPVNETTFHLDFSPAGDTLNEIDLLSFIESLSAPVPIRVEITSPGAQEKLLLNHETLLLKDALVCRAEAFRGSLPAPDVILDVTWELQLVWDEGSRVYYRPGPDEKNKLTGKGAEFIVPCSAFRTGGELTIRLSGTVNNQPFEPVVQNGPVISIDDDPSNSLFSAEMRADIIRALAWQEGKGYLQWPRWNHYDENTGQPLVNYAGAWGVMNIVRAAGWGNWFETPGRTPAGYITARWDEVAWNWRTNIANGAYIHQAYMHDKQSAGQKTWPAASASSSTPNREDLASYGYLFGEVRMRQVTESNWSSTVQVDIHSQNIRRYKAEKPWQASGGKP
jgi:hypothetical protein